MSSTNRRRFNVTFNNGTYATIEAEDAEDAKAQATFIALAGRLGSSDKAREKLYHGYEPRHYAVKAEPFDIPTLSSAL